MLRGNGGQTLRELARAREGCVRFGLRLNVATQDHASAAVIGGSEGAARQQAALAEAAALGVVRPTRWFAWTSPGFRQAR